MLGWRTRCAVEVNPYARSVLLARQSDGSLDRFPVWDDIRTFDGSPWRNSVDIVSGGFPCQGISAAGKGRGLADPRSGLWFQMLRVIKEVQPRFVFAENTPHLRTRGLGIVIDGLTRMGYDVRWGVLGAWHVGAPHKRNRMWIAAAHPNRVVRNRRAEVEVWEPERRVVAWGNRWWSAEPPVGRMAHGVANRSHRLRCIGNGQVPFCAAAAWLTLSSGWR